MPSSSVTSLHTQGAVVKPGREEDGGRGDAACGRYPALPLGLELAYHVPLLTTLWELCYRSTHDVCYERPHWRIGGIQPQRARSPLVLLPRRGRARPPTRRSPIPTLRNAPLRRLQAPHHEIPSGQRGRSGALACPKRLSGRFSSLPARIVHIKRPVLRNFAPKEGPKAGFSLNRPISSVFDAKSGVFSWQNGFRRTKWPV